MWWWWWVIVNRKRECSIFLFLSKEFLLNDTSSHLSAHHFCFALPKTKDGAESRVVALTDTRGFPCFYWKPILVTFQVWLAVFSGVLWLIFVFVFSFQKIVVSFSRLFGQQVNCKNVSRSEWPVEWAARVRTVLLTQAPVLRTWFKTALDPHLPSLCCVGGGRSFHRWGLMCEQAPRGTSRGLFLVYLGRIERMKKNLPYAGILTILVYSRTLEGKQCYSLVWSKLSKWENASLLLLSQ